MNCESILRLSQQYATETGLSLSSVSTYATGSGDMFSRLDRGHDITTRRATRIVQWFSDNWPLGLLWPADIPRPDPAPDSPHVKALAESMGLTLIEPPLPSDPARALNAKGHLADPRALATSLVFVPTGIDDTELVAAMVGSYYQVVAQYADGKARAHKHPRAKSRAAEVLRALMDAGDVRFAERIAREQAVMENFSSLQTGAA